jgi:hypothetical protein
VWRSFTFSQSAAPELPKEYAANYNGVAMRVYNGTFIITQWRMQSSNGGCFSLHSLPFSKRQLLSLRRSSPHTDHLGSTSVVAEDDGTLYSELRYKLLES